MTIRLLSLLATLNKAVKAKPPVTLTTLKEVEEEIKQGLAWFCLSTLTDFIHAEYFCVNLQPAGLERVARVLYQITCKVEH